jgi:hypothetical protein
MNTLAPVILFVYNRPEHTRKTVEALLANDLSSESDLYVFSDGPKKSHDAEKVEAVRSYIRSLTGFRSITITEHPQNKGLANSVIGGVSSVFNSNEKAIVLEDDLVTSKNFLRYMNDALNFYASDPRIFSISGYGHPLNIPADYPYDIYLSYRCSSWGWATWKDRWRKADWDVPDYPIFIKDRKGQKKFNLAGDDYLIMLKKQMTGLIDSWAIRWGYTHYKNNAYCLYPVVSKIQNIGTDNTGIHSKSTNKFNIKLDDGKRETKFEKNIQINPAIIKSLHRLVNYPLLKKIYYKIKYR